MKVIYKNFWDKEIDEAQALLSDEYSKAFVQAGGLVKKEELYVNNKLERILYYKENGETEDAAILQLKSSGVPFSIRDREWYGDFIIMNVNAYVQNQLVEKWKFLADAVDFILCTQAIDMDSDEPVYLRTVKYLGEYSDGLEPNYCKFVYNDSGEFQYCDYNYVRDYESEIFELDRLPLIKKKFNLTDEMYNYYLTAELLPPLK
jgi:hypothetical protein